ncbi:MAG: HAMP domain-containing protein [Clostridiaceae bacterium]|nr:HAMP domain-containing protein [Clostridiaceae bacterium]
MIYSLRTRLSLSFVAVVLISVLLVSVVTNLLLDKHFKKYILENQERKNTEIVALVRHQYRTGGEWDRDALESICISALEQGLILKVLDSSGKLIWDATHNYNEQCEQMLAHMAQNMSSRYPNWDGSYVEDVYPVVNGSGEIGKVVLGYYGPFYFSDSDLEFINTLNRLFLGVGALSIVLSFLTGSLMAKRLSTPISRVTDTARMISRGYFGGRITEPSGTKEIVQLTEAINNLAETLENQEALRKRLTADVAHELRTPLATLQSHMEAMIDGIWEPDAKRLESCHEEIMRISRMIGDIEKLAKYESDSLILTKTSFDVSELIRHIIRNFENEYAGKGVKIEFAGVGEIITADKDKISQVIINLLSNALKYTPEGGLVQVSVRGSDDAVMISVKDTGTGIHPEDLPYIFERFYRADKSRNRLTGGAGIGLTIAKAIVDAHKGSIQVQSEVDKGTEFIVTLPG